MLHVAGIDPDRVGLADVPRRLDAGQQLLLEHHGVFDFLMPIALFLASRVDAWTVWQRGAAQAHERSQAVRIEAKASRLRELLVGLNQVQLSGCLAISVACPGEVEAEALQLDTESLAKGVSAVLLRGDDKCQFESAGVTHIGSPMPCEPRLILGELGNRR